MLCDVGKLVLGLSNLISRVKWAMVSIYRKGILSYGPWSTGSHIVDATFSIMCTILQAVVLVKMSRISAARRRIYVKSSLKKAILKLTSI